MSILLAALALAAVPPALAQEPPAGQVQAAAEALPEMMRRQIQSHPEWYLRKVMEVFRQHTAGDAVTEDDFRRVETARRAEARARSVARLMRRDLDGDGRISGSEYVAEGTGSAVRAAMGFLRFLAFADRDGDAALGVGEIAGWVARAPAGEDAPADPTLRWFDLRRFDVDGDGRIAEAEVRAVVAALAPPPAAPARRPPRTAPAPVGTCRPPLLPADADVVVLSGHMGVGLSSVAVDGLDSVTSVATVEIEPGSSPLYVFASAAQPVIWRIGGATGRIARFVVEPQGPAQGPGAGVVGLPPGKVAFLPAGACAEPFAAPDSSIARRVAGRLARGLGVDPGAVTIVAHSRLDAVRLPSGAADMRTGPGLHRGLRIVDGAIRMESGARSRDGLAVRSKAKEPARPQGLPNSRPAPAGAHIPAAPDGQWKPSIRGHLQARLLSLFPDGLVELDPASVVAPGPVAAYDVLPGQAGMIQLLDSGAMREVTPGAFLLTRAVPRFPAGLNEPANVIIVIDKGVPVPAGSAGRVRVFLLETGECISGANCK